MTSHSTNPIYSMYRIFHPDKTECYIGSTYTFTDRKRSHKLNCNNPTYRAYTYQLYQFIRDNGGWDEWKMEEIEKFQCSSPDPLVYRPEKLTREKELTRQYNATLNTISQIRTPEELNVYQAKWARDKRAGFSEEEHTTHLERRRQWREDNKDTHNTKSREKYKNDPKFREKNAKNNKNFKETNPHYFREWSKKNYEETKEDRKKEVICECGASVKGWSMGSHLKSDKHKKLMIDPNYDFEAEKARTKAASKERARIRNQVIVHCGCGEDHLYGSTTGHRKKAHHVKWMEKKQK